MTHTKTRTTGAALLAALLLGSTSAPLHAQNGATGAGTAAPGTAGNAGANGNTGANGGATNNGATGATGTPGVTGNNAATGNNAVNGTTGTGTNGTLSNGTPPGGSVKTTNNPTPQHYDIARTIADALQSSADVQTAARIVQIDQKRADAAAAQGRPNVNAQGSATRFDSPTKVAFNLPTTGGTSGTSSSPPQPAPELTVLGNHTETLSLNLSEQLDIAGQIRAATDQYRLQSLADQFLLQQARNARILRAQTIYYNLLRAQHQVQVAQANLQDAQQQQTDALNLYNAGTGQKIDLLRANTQVAQDQQQLTQAQNNDNVAQSTFNDLVGRPLTTPLTVDDVPGVTVGQPVANTSAVGAPSPEATFTPFTVAPSDVSGIDLDQSLQTAYNSRPEILADQVNVRVAETGVTLARAGLQPTLRVEANGLYYPTPSFQFPRQRVAQVMATLTIPLYDGNATHDRIQEAQLQRDNAQTMLESQRSDVALDVRQAYLNLVTAANQIDAANSALQQAVAARQLAEVRYRGGVGLYLEVTDAQAALVQAENSQINAVYDYLVARAQFENAVGTPQAR